MDSSYEAEAVVGAGRGALVVALFGAGWLGWGLGVANAFTGVVPPAFGLIELVLVACSVYTIVNGRKLRKQYPPIPEAVRRATRRSFLIVVVLEGVAIGAGFLIAWRLNRPDLGADWAAMIVGLHFLPLAKIFRAPQLGVIGILTALWCALCWILFRSNALVISATIGTGILLWIASISALFRARRAAQSLRAKLLR